jgi:hypothetical protein
MPDTDRSSALFRGLLALALALVVAGALTAWAVRGLRRAGDEVAVTGSARRPVRADYAVWRLPVSVQAPQSGEGVERVRTATERVRAFLRERGVADSGVIARPLESYPVSEVQDGRETGRLTGYRITQVVEVRSADVALVTRLATEGSVLLSEGVPVSPQAPEYLFTRLADIRAALLADATRDARARAEAIAGSTGNAVGPVRSARMGVFQITPRNSTEVSDYGINDVSSVEKDVTAVVRVSFSVE